MASKEFLLCRGYVKLVEDDFHVVIECTLYDDIHKDCLKYIAGLIPIFVFSIDEQFIYIVSNPKSFMCVSKSIYLMLSS